MRFLVVVWIGIFGHWPRLVDADDTPALGEGQIGRHAWCVNGKCMVNAWY